MKMPLLVLVAVVLLIVLAGCTASLTTGQQAPNQLQQLATLALVDAARIGVTAELSPRIEQVYAQGKVSYPEYVTLRQMESAALVAFADLRTKTLAGQPVTQADISNAETSFIVPLQNLVAQYVPLTLPTTQPAK